MGQTLHIERATLSGIVATLVRKGLVDQIPDSVDQRQRVLRLTASGTKLWSELPDPIAVIGRISLAGIDDAEIETTIRVLQTATQRINGVFAVRGEGVALTPRGSWPPETGWC